MTNKVRTGTVISNAMTGTVTVAVNRMKTHPMYNKRYRVTKKYHADTAGKSYAVGTVVTIEETLPISKTKSWKVTGISVAEVAS